MWSLYVKPSNILYSPMFQEVSVSGLNRKGKVTESTSNNSNEFHNTVI